MVRVEVASTAEWAQACSDAFVPLNVRSATPRFVGNLEQVQLGQRLALTRVSSGASEVYRSERTITQNPRDSVLLSIHRHGLGLVRQHGRTAHLAPGTAAIYDTSVPYDLSFPGTMSEIVLQISRSELRAHERAVGEISATTLRPNATLRALTSLAAAADPRRATHPTELEAIADAMIAVIRASLTVEGHSGGSSIPSSMLLIALKQHVHTYAHDPRLDPSSIARAHHVSVRLVQKLFAADGDTPAAFIRRVRLDHARALLTDGRNVSQAATASGFTDTDTFTRAFRKTYGLTPSEHRRHSTLHIDHIWPGT